MQKSLSKEDIKRHEQRVASYTRRMAWLCAFLGSGMVWAVVIYLAVTALYR